MSGDGFARRVTLATLGLFAPLLKKPRTPAAGEEREDAADDLDEANDEDANDPEREAAEALFSGNAVPVGRPFDRMPSGEAFGARPPRPPGTPRRSGRIKEPTRGETNTLPGVRPRGPLLWLRRGLPASSVQRQSGNPTGGLRLVQAGFTDATGAPIDQTTYFRNDAFGRLAWGVGRQKPYREDAFATFRVFLLGADYGVHNLRVSHKPTGEAGQNNYTTILHWGDLGGTVYDLNLVGRTVSIFGPPPGQNSPFVLEVA
jgi:hypothetical protein